jgi:hypothetical protein
MRSSSVPLGALIGILSAAGVHAQERIALAPESLTLINVTAERVVYRGVEALRVLERSGPRDTIAGLGHALAIIPESAFAEGIIELRVAGLPRAGADTSLRGFIGIAFHVQPRGLAFRSFYLRPTNGRSQDQLRRNHATQYISEPDYPWYRLRREQPGVFESYVDLVPGEWTSLRIEVQRDRAMLYVGGAEQPTLIINDMKAGAARGSLALWIGLGTEGYFSDMVVRSAP